MGQRPNELTPHESLHHYWGAELRALRTQRGMALADLAHQVHCDSSYLGKIERAERTISADLAASCDAALDAHGTLIRLHTLTESDRELAPKTPDQPPPHEDNNSTDEANLPGTLAGGSTVLTVPGTGKEIIVPARTADGRIVFVSVPRRVFLHGLGTTALALTAIPATAAAHQISGLQRDINPVEHFQQLLQVLSDNDRLFGGHQIAPVVRGQITVIQQLRSSMRGADEQALVRVEARYTEFNGWLYQDAGEYQLAESYVDRALALCQMAADHDLAAYFMARRGDLANDMQKAVDAIGAGEQALRMAPPRSRIAAIAPAYAAHGYALSGDAKSMERAYDSARELLDASEAEPGSGPGPWFDENWIALRRARSLTVLGDHRRAARIFLDTIAGLPGQYRRGRGVWLARTALAEAGDRQVEHAATLGLEALAIGTDTGSAGILTELAHLNNALAPWSAVPEVVNFRTAMKDAGLHRV